MHAKTFQRSAGMNPVSMERTMASVKGAAMAQHSTS